MRIGISLLQFYRGTVGGAGEYIAHLVPRLLECLADHDTLVLCGNKQNLAPFEDLRHPQLQRLQLPDSKRRLTWLRAADLLWPGAATRPLARQINRLRLDVMLFPQQSLFPHGIAARKVVTIVDLLHRHFPQQFRSWERQFRLRKDRLLIAGSDRTLCISETTRRDVLKWFDISPESCSVVYLAGRSDRPAVDVDPLPAAAPAESPADAPYVLYPANGYPHKNHLRLIQAFTQFRAAYPELPGRLVLSGGSDQRISRAIERSPARDDIEHVGYVSAARLAELYAGCRAVFFPSLFEGFGIPLLEALGHSKPVFCSDLPVFRELAADAVEYFDPTSTSAMAARLHQVFSTDHLPVSHAAYVRMLSQFSWERCARETYEALCSVVRAPGGGAVRRAA